MTTEQNGHNPDDMPDIEAQAHDSEKETLRAGIGEMLALDQGQGGLGFFNPVHYLARMSQNPQEWIPMTEYKEREIQIQGLRFARRHRARYGNSRLDQVDYKKALMRVSLGRAGRHEIERMVTAERLQKQQIKGSEFQRISGNGGGQQDMNPMKLSG